MGRTVVEPHRFQFVEEQAIPHAPLLQNPRPRPHHVVGLGAGEAAIPENGADFFLKYHILPEQRLLLAHLRPVLPSALDVVVAASLVVVCFHDSQDPEFPVHVNSAPSPPHLPPAFRFQRRRVSTVTGGAPDDPPCIAIVRCGGVERLALSRKPVGVGSPSEGEASPPRLGSLCFSSLQSKFAAMRLKKSGSAFCSTRTIQRMATPRSKSKIPALLEREHFDNKVKCELVKFVSELYEGCGEKATQKALHRVTDIATGSLPKHSTYIMLHPPSMIREAQEIPSELVAWRTLKEVSAAEAALLVKAKARDDELKAAQWGNTSKAKVDVQLSPGAARSHALRKKAVQGSRQWFTQKGQRSRRGLASLPKALQGLWPKGVDPDRVGREPAEVATDSFPPIKPTKRPSNVMLHTRGSVGTSVKGVVPKAVYESDSDESELTDEGKLDDGERHRRQMERALMSRQLLWGEDRDSDDEARDEALWRHTVNRTLKESQRMDEELRALCVERKKELWRSMQERKKREAELLP
eukprot:Sspe_Gene.20825::Locus_7686_Transcript_1_1_Confidence_1.000_Length_1681::g.20825::m.20825